MKELKEMLEKMEPGEALAFLTPWLKEMLVHLDEEARAGFVMEMVGEPGRDKVSSMVNL